MTTESAYNTKRKSTRYMAKPDLRAFIPEFLLEFPITDISEGGMGVHHMNWPEFEKKAYKLKLRNRGREIGSIDVDVVHKNRQKAGCSFISSSEEQVRTINRMVRDYTENVPC